MPSDPSAPLRVRAHTLLRARGGTTAVARAVHEGVLDAGGDARFSYELDEEGAPDAAAGELVAPQGAGAWAAADGPALLHLHASGDWRACLRGALFAGVRTLVTLHDCRVLTGGCPYPLRCTYWCKGCVPDCPRGFDSADEVCAQKRELLTRLRPTLAAPSRWLADMAREVLPELDVRVVPNGIPWPELPPRRTSARARLGIPPDAKLMLFAAHGGVDAIYKRGAQWVEFYEQVRQRVPGAMCFIVGGDRYERRGDGLVLWPYVDNATLLGFMRAADVLVYPSQADNHPLVVLEAMSQGLAVAAFGSGGIPEQLSDPEAGVCIANRSWAELLDAVVELLGTPAKARRMGELGFAHGRKRFTVERMVADYLRLYRRLGA